MVSSFLNSKVAFAAWLAIVLAGCSRNEPVPEVEEATRVQVDRCRKILESQIHVPLDHERRVELRAVYDEVMKAYRERDVATLRDWERRLPALVAKDGGESFDEIEDPVSRTLIEILCRRGGKLEEYSDVDSFERDMESEIALARLWGDSCRTRKDIGGFFAELEADVYDRLVTYRKMFKASGLPDLERAADKFVGQWCAHVDSESGYTRMVLDYLVARNTLWGWRTMEDYSISWNAVVSNTVDQVVRPLLRVGYSPKWLKEYERIPEPNWSAIRNLLDGNVIQGGHR